MIVVALPVPGVVVRLSYHPTGRVIRRSPCWAVRLGHFLSPSLSARVAKAAFGRYFASAEPTPITDGNVLAPPSDGVAQILLVVEHQAGASRERADDEQHARERDAILARGERSVEHTSEIPSLMLISYAVFCLKQKTISITL